MQRNEERRAIYDSTLDLEAYSFQGIMQVFPNHFHEYFVIGYIENGERRLTCKNKNYIIHKGDMVLFAPLESHACEPADEKLLDYRSLNIPAETMKKVVHEITGTDELPVFSEHVVRKPYLIALLKEMHSIIMNNNQNIEKEEKFLFFISQLLEEYSEKMPKSIIESNISSNIKSYIKEKYAENITLDDISKIANQSKYHLLRSFTKENGITPYSYLCTIRIDKAKKMLKKGIPSAQIALSTGFSDQSHFTNTFKKFIGLTPYQYMKIFKD